MRLFVGLAPDRALRQCLAMLCGGLPGARWLPPETLHLTLRFVGEVAPWQADEIDAALGGLRAPGFSLTLAGTGCFAQPNGRTTLWAGAERAPALDHLHAKIETALQRAGLPAERRRFQPHVALARVAGADARLAGWMQANNLFRAPPMPVRGFTLFSSHPGRDHADYVAEAEYPLA